MLLLDILEDRHMCMDLHTYFKTVVRKSKILSKKNWSRKSVLHFQHMLLLPKIFSFAYCGSEKAVIRGCKLKQQIAVWYVHTYPIRIIILVTPPARDPITKMEVVHTMGHIMFTLHWDAYLRFFLPVVTKRIILG